MTRDEQIRLLHELILKTAAEVQASVQRLMESNCEAARLEARAAVDLGYQLLRLSAQIRRMGEWDKARAGIK